mmetsp:Transcript_32372/g.71102  ORF Transcript_32372/g.71102 Transcript_32372/m.71102 type:complete len:733 (-) Transcript_32372:70-2268(-)|eukprot:CAMPEP_0178472644 /NCGR_PEP_ID=MMETSP0696-20121128/1676_1 /TAXON_ID=265572 /ORGANISM="Extubocellulus spinifer, Strain CCMP396" /LENGTH=732 /DNA_ID=CAMNT_0020099839 /DNA_START=116 /DNA_END=2314 /DNA_ORIENTATION=+
MGSKRALGRYASLALFVPTLAPSTIDCFHIPSPVASHALRFGSADRHGRLASASTSNDEEDSDGWIVGDVQKDLKLLRDAYAKSRAEDERNEIERMELLDEFARRRRPVSSALIKYIAAPLLLAVLLKSIATMSSSETARTAVVSLLSVNAAYFWTSIVISPVLLLMQKVRCDSKLSEKFPSRPVPRWDPDYEDPSTSCRDHILCLLENWVSAISGSAVFGIFAAISAIQTPVIRRASATAVATSTRGFSLRIVSTLLIASQLITRLGALASVNQYPLLLHQLQRTQQLKPVDRFQFMVSPRVENIMNTLPIGIALDAAALMLTLSGDALAPLSATMARWPKPNLSCLVGISILGPLVHILCLKRILLVKVFTGISLSSKTITKSAKAKSSDSSSLKDESRWRYWLRWRKPQRVMRVIRRTIRDDFVLRGFGQGRYDSYTFRRVRGDEYKTPTGLLASNSTEEMPSQLPIFQNFDMDRLRGHYDDPAAQNRDTLITRANERMMKLHQEDYDKGDFKDPLGVAVKRTLNIGLSFDFDHYTSLEKGEEPSIHRLRSRAAKSAVRRCNRISEEAEEYLNTIEDPEKKLQAGVELAKERGVEVDEMADTIFNLIPTNAASPNPFSKVQAISESEALAITGVQLPDPASMVATIGEVSPNEHIGTDQPRVVDPFLDKEYRDEFIRTAKEKMRKERGHTEDFNSGGADDSISLDDDMDDEFVSDWLDPSAAPEDTHLA